jgi:hypothetical protein
VELQAQPAHKDNKEPKARREPQVLLVHKAHKVTLAQQAPAD